MAPLSRLSRRRPPLPLAAAVFAVSTLAFVCGHGGDGGGEGAKALAQGFTLDQNAASGDLSELTRSAHPFGSPRQGEILAWLRTRLEGSGVQVIREPFTATVPNPAALTDAGPILPTLTVDGANLYAFPARKGPAPCVVLLASHVDTKAVPGAEYVGANDSGSSTAVLLQQLAYLQKTAVAGGNPEHCAIAGVFFDGEEAVLPNWSDGETVHPAHIRDNTYGSRHAAGRLTRCAAGGHEGTCLPADLGGAPVVAMILMDMIGSPDLKISRDANSSPALVDLAAAGAAALGAPGAYDALPHGIEDDHMPYKVQGVPVLDLIDFNHLAYWHRPGDEPATISKESLELGARLGLYVAAAVAQNPALAR